MGDLRRTVGHRQGVAGRLRRGVRGRYPINASYIRHLSKRTIDGKEDWACVYTINRRNRRDSAPLSPIFYLFLAPTGKLYHKVQRLLAEDETAEGGTPPVVIKHRRPEPQHPA